jgi:MYXO-CTERM domain-containing protein
VPWPFPCWNWDPGFYPGWRVEASLFLGNMGEYQGQASEPPPVHEKFLSGDLVPLAQGISDPVDMLSLDSSLNNGQGEVYEFVINLGKPAEAVIPKEMDWVLQFRWYIEQAGNTVLTELNWNVNSGEFHPVRFTLPVKNPFDVELVYPQFLHDKLLLHAMLNSPWGSYDVDAKSVHLAIEGEGGRPVEPQHIARSADFSVAHGGHYKPVNITWVWDHKADNLRPGTYKATVTASNFQHSASSSTSATFRILPDGTGQVMSIGRSGQQTFTEAQLQQLGQPGNLHTQSAAQPARAPGPELPLAALALAGLALLRRR